MPLEEAISVGDSRGRTVDGEVAEFQPLRLIQVLSKQPHESLKIAALNYKALAINLRE